MILQIGRELSDLLWVYHASENAVFTLAIPFDEPRKWSLAAFVWFTSSASRS